MIKGLFRSASGMVPRVKEQEIIANNIANAGTAGFKKDRMFIRELSKAERKLMPKRSDWQTPVAEKLYVDYTSGTLDKTDDPLDLAIDGNGFFRLQGPDGNTYLTRSGSFTVNSGGFLEYPGGYLLMGESGPVQVGDGSVSVSQSGEVEVNGSIVARVAPVTVDDQQKLQKIGQSLFAVPRGVATQTNANALVQQGYTETSNVDVVREMVDMIVAYRTYEANAKALQTQDATLDNLFSRVAGGIGK